MKVLLCEFSHFQISCASWGASPTCSSGTRWRATGSMAEQQLSAVHLSKIQPGEGAQQKETDVVEMLRNAALNIFTEYLAEDVRIFFFLRKTAVI